MEKSKAFLSSQPRNRSRDVRNLWWKLRWSNWLSRPIWRRMRILTASSPAKRRTILAASSWRTESWRSCFARMMLTGQRISTKSTTKTRPQSTMTVRRHLTTTPSLDWLPPKWRIDCWCWLRWNRSKLNKLKFDVRQKKIRHFIALGAGLRSYDSPKLYSKSSRCGEPMCRKIR